MILSQCCIGRKSPYVLRSIQNTHKCAVWAERGLVFLMLNVLYALGVKGYEASALYFTRQTLELAALGYEPVHHLMC